MTSVGALLIALALLMLLDLILFALEIALYRQR